MITQDAARFYRLRSVYNTFDGVVLDCEEGKRIAQVLGSGEPCILHSHGLLTVEQSINEAQYGSLACISHAKPSLWLRLLRQGAAIRRFTLGKRGLSLTATRLEDQKRRG